MGGRVPCCLTLTIISAAVITIPTGSRQLTWDLDIGRPSPTVLVLSREKFILWEDVMVAWDEPIKSNRSEEFEAAGGGPKAGCEPLMSSTAGCGALPKSSLPEATGPDGAWLKALQSPKSPFPLVAVTKTERR